MTGRRRVVINQSNYIPWKGYFDLIHDADVFVFYDDVQFTKNDWRNRNLLKGPRGLQWLSVPVGRRVHRRISDVSVAPGQWQEQHWKTITQLYRRAPFFAAYAEAFRPIYLTRRWDRLSELNQHLIEKIARECLGITTEFVHSASIPSSRTGQDRVLDLLSALGATEYLSGPAGKAYLEPTRFDECGITLTWKDYSGYPEYAQFHPPFEHRVSVLDLLFQVGPDAPSLIWEWRSGRGAAEVQRAASR